MPDIPIHLLSTILLYSLFSNTGAGPICFKCDDVTDPSSCSTEVTCQSDEGCFAERLLDSSLQFKYLYGCQKRLLCEVLATSPQGVGRRQTSGARVERDIPVCTQCCYTDRCNQHLCQEQTEPLKLVEGPSNVTATVGSRVNLTCKFSGSPAPVYAWYHETHDVTNKAVSSEGGSTLVLPSVQLGDSGLYQCRVLNRHGQASAPPALVTVLAPPQFISHPTDVISTVGERVVLHCSGLGYPPPDIKWGFVDQTGFPMLPDSVGEIDISADHTTLTINNLTSDLTGTYSCRLRNELGTQISSSTVRLQGQPTLDDVRAVPATATVWENVTSHVQFRCHVTGSPAPNVTWYHRSMSGNLTAVRGVMSMPSLDVYVLEITEPTPQDGGQYVCRAQNGAGTKEAIVELIVQAQPRITQLTPDVTSPAGSKVTLQCDGTGTPTPQVKWGYLDPDGFPDWKGVVDDLVFSPDNKTVIISHLSGHNVGVYLCRLFNALGSDEGRITVRIS